MPAAFNTETTVQIEFNFTGGFGDTFEEEETEFEEELTRVFFLAHNETHNLVTAITIEEYRLNFNDLTKSILQPSLSHLLELNLRSTLLVAAECIMIAKQPLLA